MKLFIDQITEGTEILTEATATGEKKYFIEGVFAQAELKNRNGRIYPKSVLEKAIADYQPMIEAKRSIGELNHPATPQINPERASHLIESLKWKGNDVMGRAKILTSLPMGKIAKGLIDEGVKFGVSTRGMGSVSESNGVKTVGSDFAMNTIDLVLDPSGIDCFIDGILESKDWAFNSVTSEWDLVESFKKEMQTMSRTQIIENQAALFAKFLKAIK